MADDLTTPFANGTKLATKDLGSGRQLPLNGLLDQAGNEILGQLTASPNPQSISGRLKAAVDALSPLGGYVDGIEALLGTLNGYVGTLEAKGDAMTAAVQALTGSEYETVAASQTDQVLGAAGAAGDLLVSLLIVPSSLSPGAVTIKDGAGGAITVFSGGADSVLTKHPFLVPLGIRCSGANWKVSTGANVSVVAAGNFT